MPKKIAWFFINSEVEDLKKLWQMRTSWLPAIIQPFPKRQILNSSKLKEVADDKFKSDENGRNVSILVENTVVNGKIALYEQFLHFPECFQKTFTPDT